MFSANIDISQGKLLPKIKKYLQSSDTQPDYIDELEKGYCSGIGFITAYSLWLNGQLNLASARDDWPWLKKTMEDLSSWDENSLDSFDNEQRKQIDRYISLIQFAQKPAQYMRISQSSLDVIFADTKNRKLEKVYSLAGCFVEQDLTKRLVLVDLEFNQKSLLALLTKYDGTLTQIRSHYHTTYIMKQDENIYYVDANDTKAFQILKSNEIDQLASWIYQGNSFKSDKSSPLAFSVFSFCGTEKKLPSQGELLESLIPKLESTKDSDDLNYADKTTSLFMAAKVGCLSSLKYYLAKGADVNAVTLNGATSLFIAAQNGYLEVARELLSTKGVDVNGAIWDGTTPLITAAHNCYLEVVQALLDKGANVNAATSNGITSLSTAAENGYLDIVRALLDKDANVNAARWDGITPLFIAAQKGHLEVVQTLIDKGADVNTARLDGATPLIMAANNGHLEVAQTLIDEGADVNAATPDGITSLLLAAQNGHLEIVKKLIASNAKQQPVEINSNVLLEISSLTMQTKLKEIFAQKNIKFGDSKTIIKDFSPLHIAVLKGHQEIAKKLLENGASPSLESEYGITPYMLANDEMQKILVGFIDKDDSISIPKFRR